MAILYIPIVYLESKHEYYPDIPIVFMIARIISKSLQIMIVIVLRPVLLIIGDTKI
jgi:hypothetical protein